MMDADLKIPGNPVSRRMAPLRSAFLAGICALAAALALYIVYELGRYDGGYDRLAAAQQHSELEVTIEKLGTTNRQLRTQLAELDTLRVGRAQERAELARTIGELQSQVAHQSQELEFYHAVVSQSVDPHLAGDSGLKVEQMHITPGGGAGRFKVRLVLLQGGRPEAAVKGKYLLSLEGQASGKVQTLDFAALTDGRLHAHSFNFRYFASLDQDIVIPAGFRPRHLIVEVQSGRTHDSPVTEIFPWNVDAPGLSPSDPSS